MGAVRGSQDAEEANRAKSAFLAAASHDLRQPLQAMRILQGTLAQQIHDSATRKSIVSIGRSLETMTDMLTSLLDINQLEGGNLRPLMRDFSINDVFDALVADFREPATEKGLQWRLVRSRIAIHSDQRMLREMIRNLLSNAIRYTDRGTILVGCRRAGDKVRIEVWDTVSGLWVNRCRAFQRTLSESAKPRWGFGWSRHRAATGKILAIGLCAFHTWQGLGLLH
jgi:signal transduction histidine kinase